MDAKHDRNRRLAEALRANLRRRKAVRLNGADFSVEPAGTALGASAEGEDGADH